MMFFFFCLVVFSSSSCSSITIIIILLRRLDDVQTSLDPYSDPTSYIRLKISDAKSMRTLYLVLIINLSCARPHH